MPVARMAQDVQRPAADPLENIDIIKSMLKRGIKVTGGGDQPTIHLPYHIDKYTVEDTEVECLVVAIPLNQSLGDLRIKPRRWDDNQNKWLAPTLGITISATCGADAPPMFQFRDVDGAVVSMAAKKGITLNLGLVDRPAEVEGS